MHSSFRIDGSRSHGGVAVDLDPARMLEVTRLCTYLPVFMSEAMRTSSSPSVRFYRGGWLIVVAGNELFLWKYVSSPQSQPSSRCLKFGLPTSDMPHSALLVALLFPADAEETGSAPSGCLAISSCGGNLRLWPQITRNYVHVDASLPAPIGGLYGDEAIQLEPASVPGTFLLATRTGHLVLVDARNTQGGVVSHLLVGTSKPGHASASRGGLLSGIGRRVSSLFTMVASSGNLASPARGGGNMAFVRLITRPSASEDGRCNVYMLMEKQLDLWTINPDLEAEVQTISLVDSLLSSYARELAAGSWCAVDMAVQNSDELRSEVDVVYVLLSRSSVMSDEPSHLCLVTLTIRNSSLAVIQSSSSVDVEWPFTPTSPMSPFGSGRVSRFQLCIQALSALYPCLLACIYDTLTGRLVVIEVLTGKLVAKLQFESQRNAHTNGPTHPNAANPPPLEAFSLIGCGSVDAQNLFVFVTCQRGLLALTPTEEIHHANLPLSTEEQTTVTDAVEVEYTPESDGSQRITTSVDLASVERHRGRAEHMSVIVVDTPDRGRLRVSVLLEENSLVVKDAKNSSVVKLNSSDQSFVGLSEAAHVFWMGFKEQAAKYFECILSKLDSYSELPVAFLRLTQRLLNERSWSDARWRVFANSNFYSASGRQDILHPEGCAAFQFVTTRAANINPILPKTRLTTKLESLERLNELWSLMVAVWDSLDNHTVYLDQLIPLPQVLTRLGIRLTQETPESAVEQSSGWIRRCFAGESLFMIAKEQQNGGDVEDKSTPYTQFACTLANDDNRVESYAVHLFHSLNSNQMIQVADDAPLDEANHWAASHIASALHLASELVVFARAVQTKLAREPHEWIQPIFESVALNAGFPSSSLRVVNPQEAILQTVTLLPNLVAALGDAVTHGIMNLSPASATKPTQVESEQPGSTSAPISQSALEILMRATDLITAGLSDILTFRERRLSILREMVSSSLTSSRFRAQTHYLPCWLTDAQPHGIGDVLLNLLEYLTELGCGELVPTANVTSDADQMAIRDASLRTIEWTKYLLTFAHQRVQWATESSRWAWSVPLEVDSGAETAATSSLEIKTKIETIQRLRRLRFWFVNLRERLISAIADRLQRPEAALTLAEEFADCRQMVRLCYLLETQDEIEHQNDDAASEPVPLTQYHHHRLKELLCRVPPSWGLADHALQWYFDCGEHSRVQSLLSLLEQMKSESAERIDVHLTSERSIPTSLSDFSYSEFKKSSVPLSLKKSTARSNADPVHRFLRRGDARDHAWPHLLRTRQYAKAAEILFEEGCKEVRYIGRRKALLSLAKLAFLTADPDDFVGQTAATRWNDSLNDGDMNSLGSSILLNHKANKRNIRKPPPGVNPLGDHQSVVDKINALLECIELQERLPPWLKSGSRLLCTSANEEHRDSRYDPVVDVDALARLYVSQVRHETGSLLPPSALNPQSEQQDSSDSHHVGLNEFRSAIRLAELLPQFLGTQPHMQLIKPETVRDELLLYIWSQALRMDDWSKVIDHEDPIQICGRSFVCALVRDLHHNHQNVLDLFPAPEKLLDSKELEDYVHDVHFRYLIQSGFEYLHNLVV
ncbi:unnamed protein product [Calicophoron daubneyi]|uniref:Nucleoporin Nup133/Nup155-like N-terminal domain-containing protein n=1 Tax=Calicophoron daubneyi TaxID=300641 RepID=A0AAV2TU80_CALDB